MEEGFDDVIQLINNTHEHKVDTSKLNAWVSEDVYNILIKDCKTELARFKENKIQSGECLNCEDSICEECNLNGCLVDINN